MKISTGIAGLDEILSGGLIPGFGYLVRGGPGTGKTILGLHFLHEGIKNGENVLFISLEHPERTLRKAYKSLPLDLDKMPFLDLTPTQEFLGQDELYNVFEPIHVEEPTGPKIIKAIDSIKPTRVFLDGMTQLRSLTPNEFQFRKQIMAFLRYLSDQNISFMFSAEAYSTASDSYLQFISDGIISLEHEAEQRSVWIRKVFGSGFLEGYHSLKITKDGLQVFPALFPKFYKRDFTKEPISFGIPGFDQMLNGGIERGTSTIISGPSGIGKTTLGMQLLNEAATRGEYGVLYSFEEDPKSIIVRCKSLGNDKCGDADNIKIERVEPLDYSAEEFSLMVRRQVEEMNARIIVIDSVAGYKMALKGKDLGSRLQSLSTYLRNMGVNLVLINEIEQVTGNFKFTEAGISYMVDNIVILRYIELDGLVKKAISIFKKRLSSYDPSIREFRMTEKGIIIEESLKGLRGLLTGIPSRQEALEEEKRAA